MKRLARNRDFRLLFAGHVTSLFGDRALFVVLGIWALELTGSTGAGGIAFGFAAGGFALSSIYLMRAPVVRASVRAHAQARVVTTPPP